jgi:hypothetical protein
MTELIDAELDAYRARDLNRFLAFFAQDVAVTDFEGSVLMHGVEGMRANYGPLFANSPDLTVAIKSRIETGPFVIDLEHVVGFNNPPYPHAFDAGCVYRIADGKIIAMKLLL